MPLTGYALSCAIEVRELSSTSSWKAAEWVSPVKTTAACGHSLLAGFLQPMPKAWWGVLNRLLKLLFVTNWVNCPQTEERVCSIKMRYHGTTWTTRQCAVQATWSNAKVINALYEVCVRLAELLIANPEGETWDHSQGWNLMSCCLVWPSSSAMVALLLAGPAVADLFAVLHLH